MQNPFAALTNPFASFFDPTGRVAPTYADLQQRKKIAAAMLARDGKMPKTFGEGLAAIGDAIGDRSYYNKTLADEVAAADYEAKATGSAAEVPPAPAVTPYMPPAETVPPAATVPPAGVVPPAGAGASVVPPAAAAPGPQAAAAPQSDNTASWYNFATRPVEQGGLGVAPHQAAGIVANLHAESSPQIKPWGVVGDNGTAFGAAQWRNERFANLNNFAKANGMDPRTTEAQQAFMRHELIGRGAHGGGSEAKAYGALASAQDPSSAAAAFDARYERSDGTTRGTRQAIAERLAGIIPRDPNIAVQADRQTPLGTPADVAQNAVLAEVTGMTPQAERASYAPTASLRTGNVASDADPESPVQQSIGDTVQARRNSIAGAIAGQPTTAPPPGPQVAQAATPGVATDARPQIPKAPEVRPLAPASAPKLLPLVDSYVQQQMQIVNNPRLSDTARSAAMDRIKTRQLEIKGVNDQTLTEYNDYRKRYEDQQTPATVYSNEAARRQLEGEGAIELTAEQRAKFGIPAAQPAWMTRRGELKLGPVGQNINVNTGEKAQGKGDERLQEKLSESFIKTFEEGNTAGDEKKTLAEMRALAARVGTGPQAVMKEALGKWGIKTEGLSEIQALQAGISRLIPQQRVPGSGTSSDFDGENFKQSVVGLSKTPEGNNLIFDTMDGLADNKLARADVAGRVISGELTRAEGVKEMLGLQRQAKDLSDKVKEYLKASGQDKSVKPPVPDEVTESAAERWARDPVNASNPKARIILEDLARRRGGG